MLSDDMEKVRESPPDADVVDELFRVRVSRPRFRPDMEDVR